MIKLAIFLPQLGKYSETFIRRHIEDIAFEKHIFHGGNIAEFINDKHIIPGDPLSQITKNYFRFVVRKKYSEVKKHFIKRQLRSIRPDVVLAEYGTLASEIMPICEYLKIPLVAHFHGDDAFDRNIFTKYETKYRYLFEKAKAILVVSEDMMRQLIEYGAPEEKLHLNPYGPHEDFFGVIPSYSSNTLVSIGRFVDKKNPFNTLLAFERIAHKDKNLRLVYIGDGPLLSATINLAKSLGIFEQVNFTGPLKRDKIIEFLNESFCFIQHSSTTISGASEGTPVAILEASAAGLPVISTSHGGIKEAIVHEKTGLLSKELNLNSFSNNLQFLYENRKLAENMGINGRNFIRNNYSIDKHIKKIEEIILDIS